MTTEPDPAEITPPQSPEAYARRRGMGPRLVIALCLICIAIGAIAAVYAPRWWTAREAEAAKPSPAAVQPAKPSPAADLAAPEAENAGPAAPSQDVSGLEARVAALEDGQQQTMDAAAAALASALLAEAASTSRPFESELAALEQVLPASTDTQALRRLARSGAPTRAALAVEFDDAAARAASASQGAADQGAFFDRIGHALSRIVTIRRVGSTVGDAPDAVLARAERQVDEGDIDGALNTLYALPPEGLQAMAGWRAAAERRAEIDRHVVAIRAAALANLAQAAKARS